MAPKFRLQSLLNYKESLEQAVQVELAQLTEDLAREQEALARLQEMQSEVSRQLRAYEAESQLNLELLKLTFRFLESLGDKVINQLMVVAEASAKVEEKRQELVKVMQEKKALEKLKENFLAQQEEHERLVETRVNDEIGTTLHHLSSREAIVVESGSAAH